MGEGRLVLVRGKLSRLLARLDESFLERREHVRMALLALVAGHHVLLLGPPGTAKSLLARAICQCIDGGRYFEYLLSRFTHPDELFGPVSIPGLKEEDYRRLTEGYLPNAHVAFLDEIFKANSAILNSLLTLINERIFHHGTHRDTVPLQGLIGASNEPPEAGGNLEALYDRFLVRMAVPTLANRDNFLRVCLGEVGPFEPPVEDRLTLNEMMILRRGAASVQADENARRVLVRIREALQRAEIEASDRRWRWAVDLIKLSALTSGRNTLATVDLLLLQHCFGSPCDDDVQVQRAVCEAVLGGLSSDVDLQPLRHITMRMSLPPVPTLSFTQNRAQRVALLDELETRCDAMQHHMDTQRTDLMENFEGSPWLFELPTEALSVMIAARSRLQQVLQPFREMSTEYRGRLESFSLCEQLFEVFARYTRGTSVFFYDDDCLPLVWLSRVGDKPADWVGLMPEGNLLSDIGRLNNCRRLVNMVEGTSGPWYEQVLHVELDDDVLYSFCSGARRPLKAKPWIDLLYDERVNARLSIVGPGGPESRKRIEVSTAFVALMEKFSGMLELRFPMPPHLPESQNGAR